MDPASKAVLDQKQELVTAYAKVAAGTLTIAQYDGKLDQFYNAHGITNTEALHPDHQQTAADCAGIAASDLAYRSDGSCYDKTEGGTDPTASNVFSTSATAASYPYNLRPRYRQHVIWNVLQQPQQNGYYCGPAVAYEIEAYWGHYTSQWEAGLPLNQANIAARCDDQHNYTCNDNAGNYLQTDALYLLKKGGRIKPGLT